MPDARRPHWLGTLLPPGVRREVFDVAVQDLRVARFTNSRSSTVAGRALGSVSFGLRVAALYVQCVWLGTAATLVNLAGNIRQAVHLLRRQPSFTATTVLTLALGVGANAAVFAVFEAVLLRPLPYPAADELLILRHRDDRTGITKAFIAVGDYVDLAERQDSMVALATYGSGPLTISGEGDPFIAAALSAGPHLLESLSAAPVLGRSLRAEDWRPGAAPVVMLGHDLWQTTFSGDRAVIGRRLRVGQQDREVVGVAARGFRFPPTADTELIVPMTIPVAAPAQRKSGWVFALGRLRPGVSVDQANAQLATLSTQMELEHPQQNQGSAYYAVSLRDELIGDTSRALILLLASVGVVLLIACANVGNLLLARSLSRGREMALRTALGADRRRLMGLLIAESLVLAIGAGLAGLIVAWWGVPALVALVPQEVDAPGLADAGINVGVLVFTLGIALVTAVAVGSTSVLTLRTHPGAEALVSAGRVAGSPAARRAMSGLVVAEVALAVVLVIAAGLIVRSFAGLIATDPGFNRRNVLAMAITLPADRYESVERRTLFYAEMDSALRNLARVDSVGAGVVTPLTGNNWTAPLERSDQRLPAGERPPDVGWQMASRGFFEALEIPLRSGRLFSATDTADRPPVVIISDSLAERFFPNESAVGRRVRQGDADAEIVGIVGSIRRARLTDEPGLDMYFPFERQPGLSTTLFVRTTDDALRAQPMVRAALRQLEPDLVVGNVTTLERVTADSVAVTTFAMWMFSLFAIVALALASVGVYGVMSYVVRQRTPEFGTRVALGATRGDITWMVLRQGGTMTAIGLGAGVLVGLLSARLLSSLLYNVSATDPGTVVTTVGALGLTSLAACYLPARRAAQLDAARTLTR